MRIIMTLLIGLAFVSCETRLDPLELKNIAPKLTVNGSNNSFASSANFDFTTVISDSVKLGVDYWINYKLEEEQKSLPFFASGFKGRTQINDTTITDDTKLLKGEGKIKYSAYVEGLNDFEYSVIDRYGKQSNVRIQLECFDNLPPVAQFEVVPVLVNNPYEYKINCDMSFDKDTKFGGSIKAYRLTIDNLILYQNSSEFIHYFPSAGTYTIGLEVMDNDSLYSSKKEVSYNVQ